MSMSKCYMRFILRFILIHSGRFLLPGLLLLPPGHLPIECTIVLRTAGAGLAGLPSYGFHVCGLFSTQGRPCKCSACPEGPCLQRPHYYTHPTPPNCPHGRAQAPTSGPTWPDSPWP